MDLGGLIPCGCSWDNLFPVRGVAFWGRGGLEEKQVVKAEAKQPVGSGQEKAEIIAGHLGFSLRAGVHLSEYEDDSWRVPGCWKPVKIVSRLKSACCFVSY